MAIEFLCPNGHRLSSPESGAGKPGKCPKCGAAFRIPDQAGGAARSSDSQLSYPEVDAAGSAKSDAATATAGNGQGPEGVPPGYIIFLCPNGHKLNGPAHLAGRAGQCPHCQAKFLIPSIDAESAEDAVEVPADAFTDEQYTELPQYPLDDDELPTLEPADDLQDETVIHQEHPMALFFRRLWEERDRGGVIELHTSDGTKIRPFKFADALSRDAAGLFAHREDDGTLLVTAVPWSGVTRIVLRAKDLPGGIFE